MGYRLWDVDNHKIIRSRDVVFNENSMYKDKLQKVEESKHVSLEDVDQYKGPDNNVQAPPPQTPQTLSLIRSTRIRNPPKRYSPALYHILYTDGGEPECFDEAMQGGT